MTSGLPPIADLRDWRSARQQHQLAVVHPYDIVHQSGRTDVPMGVVTPALANAGLALGSHALAAGFVILKTRSEPDHH
jgi:hypothetical protein